MVHATSAEYTAYTGATAPADIELRLARASRLVTQATKTARYDVDEDGTATDEDVLTALREATIEQVAAWASDGTEDGTGAAPAYTNVSIGSVTLGGRTGGGPGAGRTGADSLAPQARLVLDEAGLLGQAPTTYPACVYE